MILLLTEGAGSSDAWYSFAEVLDATFQNSTIAHTSVNMRDSDLR